MVDGGKETASGSNEAKEGTESAESCTQSTRMNARKGEIQTIDGEFVVGTFKMTAGCWVDLELRTVLGQSYVDNAVSQKVPTGEHLRWYLFVLKIKENKGCKRPHVLEGGGGGR